MNWLAFFVGILLFLPACNKSIDIPVRQKSDTGLSVEAQYKKELEEIKKSIKNEVKIKLKKDGKGIYTWEVAGKDVQEILRVNETLRKRLDP